MQLYLQNVTRKFYNSTSKLQFSYQLQIVCEGRQVEQEKDTYF